MNFAPQEAEPIGSWGSNSTLRPNPDGGIAKLCAAKLSFVVCCRIMACTLI